MTRIDYEIVTEAGRPIATTPDLDIAHTLLERHRTTFDGAKIVRVVRTEERTVITPNIVPIGRRRRAA